MGGITFDGDVNAFGGILLGEGYWLNCEGSGGTVSNEIVGIPDGVPSGGTMTDMWISLPGHQTDGLDAGGWHIIGHPFNHATCVNKIAGGNESYVGDHIWFTDGTTLKTWEEAVYATWVDYKFSGNESFGGADVQYDGGGYDTYLRPGKGYWVNTYKDNLAMIIPAY